MLGYVTAPYAVWHAALVHVVALDSDVEKGAEGDEEDQLPHLAIRYSSRVVAKHGCLFFVTLFV